MNQLTSIEKDILQLLILGRSNKQIANIMEVKEKTIGNYTSVIYDKLCVTSRTQAAIWAYKNLRLDI